MNSTQYVHYQGADLELNVHKNDSNKKFATKVLAFVAVALVVACVAAFRSYDGSRNSENLMNFKSKDSTSALLALAGYASLPGVITPTLDRAAMLKQVTAMPANYRPSLSYENPCDALKKECCSDPKYPVLGGMDLVHYKLTGAVVFGDPKMSTEIVGISRTYTLWFSQKQYAGLFEANPSTYLPKYGGFDAGNFCANPTLENLVSNTIDLAKSTDIGSVLAFGGVPADVTSCDRAFASFYGPNPMNGLYNTRCVSMKGLGAAAGIISTPAGLTIKMSQLYGISPGIAIGAATRPAGTPLVQNVQPQEEAASSVSAPAEPAYSNPFAAPSSYASSPFAPPPPPSKVKFHNV